MVKAGETKERRTKASDIVARVYTVHMTKRVSGITFKNKAPRAIRELKKFATATMGTRYVLPERVAPMLACWLGHTDFSGSDASEVLRWPLLELCRLGLHSSPDLTDSNLPLPLLLPPLFLI